jgi:hypothetical protein
MIVSTQRDESLDLDCVQIVWSLGEDLIRKISGNLKLASLNGSPSGIDDG